MSDSKNGSHLENFARELGCKKGLDPMPPDQYLTYQDKRYSPALRLWAWMLAHTIRQGKRKAWAVNDAGQELTIQQAAHDLKMDDANVRRAWRELESEKRVRKDGKKLRLTGDFTLAAALDDIANRKRSEVRSDPFPPYILKQINKLSLDVQKRLYADHARERNAELKCRAEAAAAIRGIFAPREDNILQSYGVNPIRLEAEEPEVPSQLRLLFTQAIQPVLNELVQTFSESAPTRKTGQRRHKKPSVQRQTGAPSLYTENRELPEKNSTAAAASLYDRAAVAGIDLDYISQELQIDDDATRQLATGCQQVEPSITAAEIVELSNLKLLQSATQIRTGKISNPTGLLIKHVPKMCQGSTLRELRQRMKEDRERAFRRRKADIEFIRENWETMEQNDREAAINRYPELGEDRAEVA